MTGVPPEEHDEFPSAGFRARRWRRFERDLDAWLATPEGRFATWRATRRLGHELAGIVPGERDERTSRA